MIDLLMILLLQMIIGQALSMGMVIAPDFFLGIMAVLYFVLSISYGILCEWLLGGQTVGKRLLRLRVIDVQGLPLRFSQVAIRNLLRAVDLLPGMYLVGGLCCVLTRNDQRLGDIAGNTTVVHLPELGVPDLTQIGAARFNSFREHGHLAARLRQTVSPVEADLALQALLRRESLDPAPRARLFARLATHFAELTTFPEEATDGLSDEHYVRNVLEIVFGAKR
ncbi:MAG: RDD family protein [Lentisphaeria bacterium]|nr:RDD family protein [Lentisphaeria bacterium]